MEGLRQALEKHWEEPTTRLPEAVVREIVEFSEGSLRDDVAILIVEPTRSRLAGQAR
jgi:serine phosphatase RsbU (regulator of sigma subunit)